MKFAEENGFDHIRNIIEKYNYKTKRIDKETVGEYFRETNKNFFFIVDRFDLPRNCSSFIISICTQEIQKPLEMKLMKLLQ
jgi:hypothetical protein